MRTVTIASFLLLFLAVSVSPAQTPLTTAFTYQGRLKNGGAAVNGPHDVRFRLYNALTGGSQVGSVICVDNLSITDGLFTVPLDFGAQFAGDERFLEIEVRADTGLDCTNVTGYTVLAPRQSLTATPNALFAKNADRLDGLDSSAFLQSIPVPLTLSGSNASHVVQGQNSSVAGGAGLFGVSTALTGNGLGVYGRADSSNGYGVYGQALSLSGNTFGGRFESNSTSGQGVFGMALANSGTTYGGHFENVSPAGAGALGISNATTGNAPGVHGKSFSVDGRGVFGEAASASGANTGVWGQSSSATGRGVYGLASASTGAAFGVLGESASTSGRGVYGKATSATGANWGGYFESVSTSGTGVLGVASSNTGATTGMYGLSSSPNGIGITAYATALTGDTHGVFGQVNSTTGRGVTGKAVATSGFTYGGYFESTSPTGYGVLGYASSATGINFGGRFVAASTLGTAVSAAATATTGTTYGGRFDNASTTGIGVNGVATATTGVNYGVFGASVSTSGRGVQGHATATSGTIYGVYGEASVASAGYGVFANGDMGASGLKPFRIDHPDDPSNMYLLHYAAESPEVINFYRGTVVLDQAGQAVVELPHYFGKINKNPSYQLTAVGAPMPMLHVSEEIDEAALNAAAEAGPEEAAALCSFRIAGGVAGAKVAWEVQAQRNDLWVRERGAPVEVQKQDLEHGTYQHPEFYNQPVEKSLTYRTDQMEQSATVIPTGSR